MSITVIWIKILQKEKYITWPRYISARLLPRFELKKGFLKKTRPKIAFG